MKAVALVLLLAIFSFFIEKKDSETTSENHALIGAWELMSQNGQVVADRKIRIITSGYFVDADFSAFDKRFNGATAGTYTIEDGKLKETYLVSSRDPAMVGTTEIYDYTIIGQSLQKNGHRKGRRWLESWSIIKEEHDLPLTGTWSLGSASEDQPRKSWKILSGGRFQWIYFNANTGEYYGTMGGFYDINESSYTEHYEFYPQDTSKVGTSKSFTMELDDKGWHLSGTESDNSAKVVWVQIDKKGPN